MTADETLWSSSDLANLASLVANQSILRLFVDCVIPGCRNPVSDVGDVCDPCRIAFGPYLTTTRERPALTEAEIAERDDAVRSAYRQHTTSAATDHLESKANQICWLCEQRRTCTHLPHRWECDRCRTVT